MVDIHHFEDGGAVVGDRDVVVGRDHHLVEALGAERRAQRAGHRLGGLDVRLKYKSHQRMIKQTTFLF